MKQAVEYLRAVHDIEALIVYGSYADHSYYEASDFNAIAIAEHPKCRHDTTVVRGLQLDVWLYTPDELSREFDPQKFLQIHNGIVAFDKDGIALRLLKSVQSFASSLNYKDIDVLREEMLWCENMLLRIREDDAVAGYRWHILLTESLKVYCDIKQKHFLGPKHTLRMMEEIDVESFCLYSHAVKWFEYKMLRNWIMRLRVVYDAVEKEHLRWRVNKK